MFSKNDVSNNYSILPNAMHSRVPTGEQVMQDHTTLAHQSTPRQHSIQTV